MALERAGVGKFAKLVANHVFRDINRHMLLAVMHSDGKADEVGQNRRTPGPGFDRALVRTGASRLHLLHQVMIDERAFFDGT
jgi:hypothetical protein